MSASPRLAKFEFNITSNGYTLQEPVTGSLFWSPRRKYKDIYLAIQSETPKLVCRCSQIYYLAPTGDKIPLGTVDGGDFELSHPKPTRFARISIEYEGNKRPSLYEIVDVLKEICDDEEYTIDRFL